MVWERGWHKTKQRNGFLIYTYSGGHGNYMLNDFAFYNKGAVSLNYHGRDCGDIDTHYIKRTLSEYFRQYGRRIVIVEKCGTRSIFCRVEVYFLYPELPTDEELDTWFRAIKSKVHEY